MTEPPVFPIPSEAEMDRAYTQWEREQKVVVTPVDTETVVRYYPHALPPEWEELE